MAKCDEKMEVYSRVVGYFRPVQNWNPGKKQEFADRVTYKAEGLIKTDAWPLLDGARIAGGVSRSS